MAREFIVSNLPLHRNLFGDSDRMMQILAKSKDMKDLLLALRGVISHGKYEPISQFEQDVLCDLYNSISFIKFK